MRALQQLIGAPMPKNIDEIIRESNKLRHPFQHFSTVLISDREIIKGVSQSKPDNLILANFGEWLADVFRQPTNASLDYVVDDTDGVSITFRTWSGANVATSVFCRKNTVGDVNIGTTMEFGSGVTAATRADIQIETNLPTAPEDDSFDTGAGSYAAGAISVAGAVTAGGAGTINETLLAAVWVDVAHAAKEIALFHDILTSGEAFVLGNTLTCAYTINL